MQQAPHLEPAPLSGSFASRGCRYNDKILHETMRVAVCDVMDDTLQNRAMSSNGVSPTFQHTRRQLFLMHHERYLHEVQRMSERNDIRDGTQFTKMPFECGNNGMSGNFQWVKLQTRLSKLHAALMSEIEDWRRQGAEQTSLLKAHHDAAVNSCIHYLRQQEDRIRHEMPEGASIGADETNACVWVATIFGPSETLWDGGMFQVEFIFPPDFPEAPPFVHFLTSMFHPHINSQGVPYLRTLVLWKHADPKEKTISALVGQLISLLSVEPSPEPTSHLNNTAADLHFSRNDDERKEYKRRVKRCVQRSMDM